MDCGRVGSAASDRLYFVGRRALSLVLRAFSSGGGAAGRQRFAILAEINSFVRINDQIQNGGPSDVMLPIVDWQAYRDVGEWLDQQTPPDATVGVAEVGQVGFYANRWMTDYLGLLQPDVAAALKRGDLYSWLAGYAPDYLVFQ